MISKELLSEVLGEKVIESDESSTGGNILYYLFDDDDWWYSVNIHELAHKCKEWAKGHGYQILSGVDEASTYRADVYYVDFMITDYETIELSEPEAIFKACEWIKEQL